MIASIVDTDALLQVAWVSLVAGVGVPSCFGLAILGSVRAVEFGRNGRPVEAAVFAIIGALGLGVVIASIVFGILTLIND
jgi:predicted membrane protein